jgi:hypothetical protein
MMPLFHISVLVATTGLDLLSGQTVATQQRLVAARELRRTRRVVDRCRQPIGAMPFRHLAQLPERVLQAFAQTLEALGKADRPRFPVRVRQHEVVDQVREALSLHRDL